MTNVALHTIEICAGVAMLGEGLRAGLTHMGIQTRVCVYVEREAYPAGVLAARMEEGSLDSAPIWSDLLTFDARRWHGAVDGIVAGFPCQDLSLAGKRAGLDGKRSGLFFDILDIAVRSGAWFLFLENVSGIASATASVVDEAEGDLEERAAARVMGELADRGWNAEWLTLSASDVGASHGRERWFCFAWRSVADTRCSAARGIEHEPRSSGQQAEHQLGLATLDDAQRPERWPERVAGTGGVQGDDRGRPEAHGRTGEPDEALGPAESKRCGEARQCDAAGGSAGTDGPSAGMAHASQHGWHEGRTKSGREQGRSDAAQCSSAVADASRPGLEGCELGRALHGNWGGASTWTS